MKVHAAITIILVRQKVSNSIFSLLGYSKCTGRSIKVGQAYSNTLLNTLSCSRYCIFKTMPLKYAIHPSGGTQIMKGE